MAGQKFSDAAPSGHRPGFGDLNQSMGMLGNAMSGKTIVFVVDWRDIKVESSVLKYALFEQCGAGEKSGTVSTEDFLAKSPIEADVLILRSSRYYEQRTSELLGALESFRKANPKCAVILCAFTGSVVRAAGPLLESGVVNCIDSYPPNDFELLRKAADVLERLASQ
jgi:hypothetical protein